MPERDYLSNYNEDSKKLCDRMAEGNQARQNLTEVRDEFNKWLFELNEVFEEEGEEKRLLLAGKRPARSTREERSLIPVGKRPARKPARREPRQGSRLVGIEGNAEMGGA